MIIYNITFQVEWKIYEDWLRWMNDEYITRMMSSGSFDEVKTLRLLDVDEREGPTVAIQFTSPSIDIFRSYQEIHAREQSRLLIERWNTQIVFFSSVMELVQ